MTNIGDSLVSIITPCYNHEKFLQEFIESVYSQTYRNFEFFIIDDGSTDGSLEIIKRLSEKYHFEYESQSNHGICYTLNRLLKKTKGKYVVSIASDDVLLEDRLEKQVKFMEAHPEYGMCYAKIYNIIDGKKIDDKYFSKLKCPSGWVFDELLKVNFMPAPTVMVKKTVYKKVGDFDENLFAEDYDMWLRISQRFQIGYLDEYLTYYRLHPNSMIANKNTTRLSKSLIMIFKKYKDHPLALSQLRKNYLRLSLSYSGMVGYKFLSLVTWVKSFPYGFSPINILKMGYNLLFFWQKL